MFLVLVVPIIVRAPYRGFRNLNNTSIFQIYGFKKKKLITVLSIKMQRRKEWKKYEKRIISFTIILVIL